MANGKLVENINSTTSIMSNIISSGIALTTAFGVSLVWFKDYMWEILTTIELFIIIGLIFYSRSKKELAPMCKDIANKELFDQYFMKEAQLFHHKFSELNDGYMNLFGEDVLEVQSALVDFTLKAEDRTIRTLDLTSNPGLWLTRTKYINMNKKFIESGGVIQRVLIIDGSKLLDKEFSNNLIKLIEKFENIGVIVGLQLEELLNEEELQDFIVYDNFAVLAEGKQADENYKKASSTAYFKENKVVNYKQIFYKVWEKSATSPSSQVMLQKFRSYVSGKEKVSLEEFKEHEKEIFDEYRN